METSELRDRVFIYSGIFIVLTTVIGALFIGDSIQIGYLVSGAIAILALLILGYCYREYEERDRGTF